MDIALCLERLVPQAEYSGSVTDNTKETYDKLRWDDKRKKPSWGELVQMYPVVKKENESEENIETTETLIERKIREMVDPKALIK